MATLNPFDLLGDDDTEDPSQFIAAAQQKVQITADKKGPASAQPAKPVVQAKLPSKPLPPAQAGKVIIIFDISLFDFVIRFLRMFLLWIDIIKIREVFLHVEERYIYYYSNLVLVGLSLIGTENLIIFVLLMYV